MIKCADCGLLFYCVTRAFRICIWCEIRGSK
ncbi:hypothetical protein HUN42_00081 [Streptomyces phage Dagobah]|nr:hypothetical protein HUN42_00081 [Streptomyces phage Dagobah]